MEIPPVQVQVEAQLPKPAPPWAKEMVEDARRRDDQQRNRDFRVGLVAFILIVLPLSIALWRWALGW